MMKNEACHFWVKIKNMFKQNSKYRIVYLMFALLVFVYSSVYSFYKYTADIDKGMSLIGGIVYSVMAIFFIDDLYQFIKNRRLKKLNSEENSKRE